MQQRIATGLGEWEESNGVGPAAVLLPEIPDNPLRNTLIKGANLMKRKKSAHKPKLDALTNGSPPAAENSPSPQAIEKSPKSEEIGKAATHMLWKWMKEPFGNADRSLQDQRL